MNKDILNTPEGARLMRNEFLRLTRVLFKETKGFVPGPDCTLKGNGLGDGGWDFILNGHTLVLQHHIPFEETAEFSFLSIALYNLRFNKENRPLDKRGVPMASFPVDKNRLGYMEYQLSIDEKGRPAWANSDNHEEVFSSEQVIDYWITLIRHYARA